MLSSDLGILCDLRFELHVAKNVALTGTIIEEIGHLCLPF